MVTVIRKELRRQVWHQPVTEWEFLELEPERPVVLAVRAPKEVVTITNSRNLSIILTVEEVFNLTPTLLPPRLILFVCVSLF